MSVKKTQKLACGRPRSEETAKISESSLRMAEQKLRAYLAEQGLKFSKQRWQIATLILEKGVHLTSQELVRAVLAAHPGLGAATVYRNIKTLCDAGILKETFVDSAGRVVYEPFSESHHDHLVCLDCDQVFEFHDANIERRQLEIAKELQFSEVGHRHVIFVRCDYAKR